MVSMITLVVTLLTPTIVVIDPKRSFLRPPFFKDQVEVEEVYQTDESKLLNGNYVNNNGICTVPL